MARIQMHNDVAVIAIEGMLVNHTIIQKFSSQIKELTDNQIIKIVINLEKLIWFNSFGLQALTKAMFICRNKGGDLKLVKPAHMKSIFVITKLTNYFDYFNTPEEAINSFK